MSKYIKTIPLSEVERLAVVPGNGRSLAQCKGMADYCMNGGFYDFLTGKPTHHLKVNGTVLAKESWGQWGYAWDKGGDIRLEALPAPERRNYLGAFELLTPMVGPGDKLRYGQELGGKRGRTALGLTGDKLILYCSGDGTRDGATPEGLRDELRALGCETALMLDGGGSSQCDFGEAQSDREQGGWTEARGEAQGRPGAGPGLPQDGGKPPVAEGAERDRGGGEVISSSRRVNNYICVWVKKKGENEPMSKKVCLDPGHGVESPGKCAPDGSYYEHEFALDMAKRVKAQLERHGVAVALTRSSEHCPTGKADTADLNYRVKVSDDFGADLFVSLHSNAQAGTGWGSVKGYGVYTSAGPETAARNVCARKLLSRAKEAGVPIWGGGLFHDIDLLVTRKTKAPAVLIEHGFHTNREETALLKTDAYRAKLAEVDAKGILDFLGIAWKEEPEQPADKPWYEEDRAWVVDQGISDGTRPEENVTRAEVWAMLRRTK